MDGWREDRERKYVVGLEVSVDERLAWLEEMLELAHASGALPKRRDAWGRTRAVAETDAPLEGACDAGQPMPAWEERLWNGLEEGQAFFMGGGRINDAARAIAKILEDENIPYAIVGALALNAHGYERFTSDVDLLLTREGLDRLKARVLGRGYVEKFPGSKGLRDTVRNVGIDVILTGEFPGDGLAKPIAFPDPSIAERGAFGRIVPLTTLLELKLASGMTAPHRLKDLADVIELVRARALPASLADSLDPYVRAKFLELHAAAATRPDDE